MNMRQLIRDYFTNLETSRLSDIRDFLLSQGVSASSARSAINDMVRGGLLDRNKTKSGWIYSKGERFNLSEIRRERSAKATEDSGMTPKMLSRFNSLLWGVRG